LQPVEILCFDQAVVTLVGGKSCGCLKTVMQQAFVGMGVPRARFIQARTGAETYSPLLVKFASAESSPELGELFGEKAIEGGK
jgi:hypothetical protein